MAMWIAAVRADGIQKGDDDRRMGLRDELAESRTLQDLRAGKVSVAQARQLLGIASRYEMDGFLKRHGLLLPLAVEDVERDAETALRFRVRS